MSGKEGIKSHPPVDYGIDFLPRFRCYHQTMGCPVLSSVWWVFTFLFKSVGVKGDLPLVLHMLLVVRIILLHGID